MGWPTSIKKFKYFVNMRVSGYRWMNYKCSPAHLLTSRSGCTLLQVSHEQNYTKLGRVMYDRAKQRNGAADELGPKYYVERHRQYATCFPLKSLQLALGRTGVDYWSLNVEGLELDVLGTIPWKRFDVRTIFVEHKHVKHGKQAVTDYMTRRGYQLMADLDASLPGQSIFVDDFVFVKQWTSRRKVTQSSSVSVKKLYEVQFCGK